jgi:UDP-galactopyranose mutase
MSHLRWDFVWQRPQHLLSRFARETPVLFVEEPEFLLDADEIDFRVARRQGVTVVTPLLPQMEFPRWGFNDLTNPIIQRIVTPLCTRLRLHAGSAAPLVLWYYTPMALGAEPLGFEPDVVVFDAMDELSAFHGAPTAMATRESALLSQADLVFTGGPSLYEARRRRHPAVSCFPSGVEAEHFAAALTITDLPTELAERPRPIIGYYGVIDERVDLDLIAAIADSRPAWTIAMVGPHAKISASNLPRHPNIVYCGKQEYSALPGYLASFDVALLPFARNEATRFISPTKTLEYLAAGKPVVSTPIRDVVALYGDVVGFGADPDSFIAAIEHALAESPAAAPARQRKAATLVSTYHWDTIAARMWTLIEAAADRAIVYPRALAAR